MRFLGFSSKNSSRLSATQFYNNSCPMNFLKAPSPGKKIKLLSSPSKRIFSASRSTIRHQEQVSKIHSPPHPIFLPSVLIWFHIQRFFHHFDLFLFFFVWLFEFYDELHTKNPISGLQFMIFLCSICFLFRSFFKGYAQRGEIWKQKN